MNTISKLAVFIGLSVLAGYIGFTWFYFGSPHPCTIAAKVLEAESAEQSDEWWLDFARSLAIINLNYMNMDQSQRDKLAKELWTAPPEVVQKYLEPGFNVQKFVYDMVEKTKDDTPANCVEMLYIRVKKRFSRT